MPNPISNMGAKIKSFFIEVSSNSEGGQRAASRQAGRAGPAGVQLIRVSRGCGARTIRQPSRNSRQRRRLQMICRSASCVAAAGCGETG
jgi:hypothetical protein